MEPDVPPHEAFAGLLLVAAHDCRDAVADAQDRAVLLVAEQARGAVVYALGEVGQPVMLAPDDAFPHLIRQFVGIGVRSRIATFF